MVNKLAWANVKKSVLMLALARCGKLQAAWCRSWAKEIVACTVNNGMDTTVHAVRSRQQSLWTTGKRPVELRLQLLPVALVAHERRWFKK